MAALACDEATIQHGTISRRRDRRNTAHIHETRELADEARAAASDTKDRALFDATVQLAEDLEAFTERLSSADCDSARATRAGSGTVCSAEQESSIDLVLRAVILDAGVRFLDSTCVPDSRRHTLHVRPAPPSVLRLSLRSRWVALVAE
jgi:hypothetical protein